VLESVKNVITAEIFSAFLYIHNFLYRLHSQRRNWIRSLLCHACLLIDRFAPTQLFSGQTAPLSCAPWTVHGSAARLLDTIHFPFPLSLISPASPSISCHYHGNCVSKQLHKDIFYLSLQDTQSKSVSLHAMQVLVWGGGIAATRFRPRHYMRWVVSITPRPRFTPGERAPGTHCIAGYLGPTAGLDAEVRGKILCSLPGNKPRWCSP
jgi:hypothetical protein